ERGRARITGAVKTAAVHRRLAPDRLHDVDLAARWPAAGDDVVAQQPEGRPQAAPRRQLDARLEATVSLFEQALGLEPCRGIGAVAHTLRDHRDHQVPGTV